jgi:hypothetical protein
MTRHECQARSAAADAVLGRTLASVIHQPQIATPKNQPQVPHHGSSRWVRFGQMLDSRLVAF